MHFAIKDDAGHVLFTEQELRCKESGGIKLASGFQDALKKLRLAFNQPMRVLSCCRSQSYNQRVGGVKKSFHIYDNPAWEIDGACAIDIATPTESCKKDLLKIAQKLHWSIGMYHSFLHLDRRSDYLHVDPVLFVGKGG